MSTVQIERNDVVDLKAGRTMRTMAFVVGRHRVEIVSFPDYCVVQVNNAMQRISRSLGKRFESFDAALEHYKTAEIRIAIETAKELNEAR